VSDKYSLLLLQKILSWYGGCVGSGSFFFIINHVHISQFRMTKIPFFFRGSILLSCNPILILNFIRVLFRFLRLDRTEINLIFVAKTNAKGFTWFMNPKMLPKRNVLFNSIFGFVIRKTSRRPTWLSVFVSWSVLLEILLGGPEPAWVVWS